MTTNETKLFQQTKRRLLGDLLHVAHVKTSSSWLDIHHSSKDLLFTYESAGLVVSLNGGGSIDNHHPDVEQARHFVEHIHELGGIILDGGKKTGIMSATKAADASSIGVVFPEIAPEARTTPLVTVNSPTPRIELLATCAPIVVIFRGGLGTFQVLMRSIVHIKNRRYHPDQLAQRIFVSEYWIGLLSTMVNLGTIPKEYVTELTFFSDAQNLIEHLPSSEPS